MRVVRLHYIHVQNHQSINLIKFIKKFWLSMMICLWSQHLRGRTQVSLTIWLVNMDQWVLVQWKSLPQQGKNWSRKTPLSTFGIHMYFHTVHVYSFSYTYLSIHMWTHIPYTFTFQKCDFGGNCTEERRINRKIEIIFVLIWSRLC